MCHLRSGWVKDIRLSIVDTKNLPSTTLVLYTPSLAKFLPSKVSFEEEYLCFGDVCGPTHKAVRYYGLLEHGLWELSSRQIPPEQLIATAQRIGGAFGNAFTIPAASCLLARKPEIWEDFVNAVADRKIPADWVEDTTVMRDGFQEDGGFAEASIAVGLL